MARMAAPVRRKRTVVGSIKGQGAEKLPASNPGWYVYGCDESAWDED